MTSSRYEKLQHAIRFWLLRRLPPCQQTVKVISQSMERPLSLREQVLLKLHLWVCAWCAWYMEHLQVLRDALRAKAEQDPNLTPALPSLSNEARERIKLNLQRRD
ncbi:MAG TPA: hypothetical protein VJS64_01210 [Pyrinomonadaceae bacterium]|nr:hypothetical protein [Pyrinomonadaceae bacterium]